MENSWGLKSGAKSEKSSKFNRFDHFFFYFNSISLLEVILYPQRFTSLTMSVSSSTTAVLECFVDPEETSKASFVYDPVEKKLHIFDEETKQYAPVY
jgi:hypothetical protein